MANQDLSRTSSFNGIAANHTADYGQTDQSRLLSSVDPENWASADFPLGATVGAAGCTFAVYAPAATKVQLEIYLAQIGQDPVSTFDCVLGDDGIWRAQVSGIKAGDFYGYRVWGSNWVYHPSWEPGGSAAGFVADFDENGNRFNPNKLLFDPYAREISHTPNSQLVSSGGYDPGMFGTGEADYHGRPRREFDTAYWAPKGVVVDDHSRIGRRPGIKAKDQIIYEAHIKGLTMHPSACRLEDIFSKIPALANVDNVDPQHQGTYLGAAALAPYLKSIGINAIELLPVHETSKADASDGVLNYWGYETLGFFAPTRAYAFDKSPGGPTREFKKMVKEFHREGIEVFLDVVYNHSGEGGHWGGELSVTGFNSMGGFACPDYYTLTNELRLVDGATGVSNTLNFSSPAACQLVLDSLQYWHHEMGVDGFRFDLAPVLGRKPGDADREDWGLQRRFFPDHPLLIGIRDWASENDVELIAEAWDLWGYEVGVFPSGWAEWNGRYRDAIRCFMKGDANTSNFIQMVNGDYDHFESHGGPQKSVNFITAHDGFTLADLVSYNQKNNAQLWPFGESDGGNDSNDSWDCGGDQALRRQRIKNFWVMLMISRGLPMVVAGDEYGRTQNGNNNPYSIDSVGIWQNWNQVAAPNPHQLNVDDDQPDFRYHDNLGMADCPVNPIWVLASYLMNLRRENPALRQDRYGNTTTGDYDVSYIFSKPDGSPCTDGDRAIRLLIDAGHSGGRSLVALINMSTDPVRFELPRAVRGSEWVKVVDTAGYAEPDANCWPVDEGEVVMGSYQVNGWSVALMMEHRQEVSPKFIGSRLRSTSTRLAGKAKVFAGNWWRKAKHLGK